MESYPNVLRANCTGRGQSTGRGRKKRHRRFACGLIYTDISPGTAALRALNSREAYVKFFT